MSRTVTMCVIAICSFQLCLPQGDAQPTHKSGTPADKTLQIGEELVGEINGPRENRQVIGGNSYFYISKIPIRLEAEQSVSIHATVSGTGRKVAVELLDPTMASIGVTHNTTKSATLKLDELSVDGVYTIVVMSELVGRFTLLVTTDVDEASNSTNSRDLEGLERRIKKIEHELAALKADLAALKAKSK